MRKRMDHVSLRVRDTLLVRAIPNSIERMDRNRDFIVAGEIERRTVRESKIPVALGIVAAVDFLPIMVAALAVALLVVLTGRLEPNEVYDSVQWDVIVLLAGGIPLSASRRRTPARPNSSPASSWGAPPRCPPSPCWACCTSSPRS